MIPYSCIIIDDEEHAIGLLTESLKGLYNNINIIGNYSSWKAGLDAVRTEKADLLFLDISIGSKNGMDILKMVPSLESEVIFVTACAEHALDAFKLSATGYVIKPIGEAELYTAVNKAIEHIDHKRLSKKMTGTLAHMDQKIGIPNGKGINYYNIDEILYFEAVNNYTKIVTKDGDVTSSYNMGKFKSILEGLQFFQVHRSFIVNINHVSRYETAGTIIMVNKKELPVAKSSREEFLKRSNILQANNS